MSSIELTSVEQDEASLKSDEGEIESYHNAETLDDMTPEQLATIHSEIDADHDGKISLSETVDYAHRMRRMEANKELSRIMVEHDKNGDGKLSLEEFIGKVQEMAESREEYEDIKKEKTALFAETDLDHNGFVEIDELPLVFQHHTNEKVENMLASQELQRKDRDGDGQLSPLEFWSPGPDDSGISSEEQQQFDQLDANHDGLLSVSEIKLWESGAFASESAMKALFKIADANQDSFITVDELLKAKDDIRDNDDAHSHIVGWQNKEL